MGGAERGSVNMPGTLNWLCNVIDFLLTTVTETSSSMLMQAISTDPPTRGWDVAPLFRSVRTSAQLPTIGRSFSPQFRTAFSTPGEGTQVIRGGGRMASPKSRSRCRSMEKVCGGGGRSCLAEFHAGLQAVHVHTCVQCVLFCFDQCCYIVVPKLVPL